MQIGHDMMLWLRWLLYLPWTATGVAELWTPGGTIEIKAIATLRA